MRSGRKMSPVSTHQGRRSSVEKEGVWAQNKMSRQWGLCRGREWDGEPSLPALGCWPVPLQPHQHDRLQRAGAITLIYTVPSSSARQVERAPLQSRTEPTTSSLLKRAGVPPLTPCTFPGLTEVGSPSSLGWGVGTIAEKPCSPIALSWAHSALIPSCTEGFFLNRV